MANMSQEQFHGMGAASSRRPPRLIQGPEHRSFDRRSHADSGLKYQITSP